MAISTVNKSLFKGGEFIFRESDPEINFIPEDKNEEQRMIEETVDSFVEQEIRPIVERIEIMEEGLTPSLIEQMGELGLLGAHMPEQYGGMNLDFITNTIIGERVGPSGSFSVSFNAHTGIGMLPILYYGTEAQKEKYLPKLISGEWKACYCLTEPGSGSDALAAKSKAVLSDDGKFYILNGQKMWITNAGFADIFTVFAQIDGEQFTAFILENGMDGLTLGAEEIKLGIKGSSTRQVFMENVKVPVENILGEVGKGHRIAFNVLNIGRFKLGASCLGGMKSVNDVSIKYANERIQFGKPISSFSAIQSKLADQAIASFVTESSLYRCAFLIEEKINQLKEEGYDYALCKLLAAQEYALECSIIKIQGSEALDFCVDEGVQIHGGMGYSEEGRIARAYRDSRINRIFEGTNEINKLVIVNTLFKKVLKGELDLTTAAVAVQQELMSGSVSDTSYSGKYTLQFQSLSNYRKLILMILGTVARDSVEGKLDLKEEQELLMVIADMIIDLFNLESTLFRVNKLNGLSEFQHVNVVESILSIYAYEVNSSMIKNAKDAFGIVISEDLIPMYMKGLKMLTRYPLENIRSHKRNIANHFIKENGYSL